MEKIKQELVEIEIEIEIRILTAGRSDGP